MKLSLTSASLAIAGLTAFAALSAQAQTPAISFTNPGTEYTNGTWSIGFEFSINAPMTVTALGFFDDPSNAGVSQSHDVGIYDTLGNLLASTTVLTTDPYSNFFLYHTLTTPLALASGTYIAVAETGSDNYAYYTSGFSTAPGITFIQDEFVYSPTLTFPTNSEGITPAEGGAWFGPNLLVTSAVPEPGAYALMGSLGLTGAAFLRRRRARK